MHTRRLFLQKSPSPLLLLLTTTARRRWLAASSFSFSSSSFASVNGVSTDAARLSCSVWDVSFQRGDGIFEVLRVVPSTRTTVSSTGGGTFKPRCVNYHLDRLERSATAMDLPLPAPRATLEQWLRKAADSAAATSSVRGNSKSNNNNDDANDENANYGIIRCIITRGGGSMGYGHHLGDELDAPPLTICLWQPLPSQQPKYYRLLPTYAPWHTAAGDIINRRRRGDGTSSNNDDDGWPAIKWLSYGPNLRSTRLAQRRGYDDALLLLATTASSSTRGDDDYYYSDDDSIVLDGPSWAVMWKRNDGTLCTPSWTELGLLESTSSKIVLEAAQRLGLPVEEGIYRLRDVERHASAMWVMSTTRDLVPVTLLGKTELSTDNVTRNNLLRTMDTIIDEHP